MLIRKMPRTPIAFCIGVLSLFICEAPSLPAQAQQPRQRPEVKWNNPERPAIPNVEHGVLHSPSMDRDVGFNVYLPPGYAEGKRKYAVVYFLHGAGGNENSDAGGFSGMVQKEMQAKHIPEVICVFPNGGMSGYADHLDQKVMGETLIIKEIIPYVDAHYRTLTTREGRAVCGFSMGGGGAIRLALKYPDLFCAAASWAAALGSRNGAADPSTLAKDNVKKISGRVRLLLIVGDKDLTFPSHAPLIQTFDELKIPYTYIKLPGVDHNLGIYHQQTGTQLVQFIAAFDKKPE
jgi:enterochelin esterase-like enzyme